jgi:hypothetical protein
VPLAQRDPQLEPGQVRPEAPVDAAAEREVPVRLAVPPHGAGVRELGVVHVGRPEDGHHVLARRDRAAADLDVPGGDAGDAHDRRLPPEQLLDHRRDRLRLLGELPPRLGMLGQVAEEAVERRRDRVEAGDQEQEADVEHVLPGEAVAVDLDVQEVAEEVVSRLALARPLVEHPLEVGVDLIGRLPLVRLGLGVAERLADHVVGPDRPVLHPQEPGKLVPRQAEHPQEDLRRERHRELPGEVDLVVVDEPVDQGVDEPRHRRLQRLHAGRGEQRVEDLPVRPVVGRVDLQRDQRTLGLQVVRRHVRREHVGVAQHLVDPRARADDHADAVEPHHRRALAQQRVGGLGVPGQLGAHQFGQLIAVALAPFAHGRQSRPVVDRMFGLQLPTVKSARPTTARGNNR